MITNKVKGLMEQIKECTPNEIHDIQRLTNMHQSKLRKKGKLNTEDEGLIESNLTHEGDRHQFTLYIHGSQFFHETGKPSSYTYVLINEETGENKCKFSERLLGETSHRVIIIGIMDALTSLSENERYSLEVVTKGFWGYSKLMKGKYGTNGDLLKELKSLLIERRDILTATVDPDRINRYL